MNSLGNLLRFFICVRYGRVNGNGFFINEMKVLCGRRHSVQYSFLVKFKLETSGVNRVVVGFIKVLG